MNAMLINLNSMENHPIEHKTLNQHSTGPTLVLPKAHASLYTFTQYISQAITRTLPPDY